MGADLERQPATWKCHGATNLREKCGLKWPVVGKERVYNRNYFARDRCAPPDHVPTTPAAPHTPPTWTPSELT
jgi:hypothetical protein